MSSEYTTPVRRPRVHVAIVHRSYQDPILCGEKTTEARLTKRAIAPWNAIEVGETIHFKVSGGGYFCTARIAGFEMLMLREPADLESVRKRYGKAIGAPDAFWDERRESKYATLVRVDRVEPVEIGPSLDHLGPGQRRSAWHVFDAADVAVSGLAQAS